MPKQSNHERRYGDAFKGARRPPLHRDRVVEQAIAILDADGPDALTFRRLAADLDVGVATLYWHVDNKDMLLQLALDQVLGEIERGFDATPERSWEERLRDWLVELWRVLRRHPWAAALAIASVERGPNMLRHWDRGAMLLLDAGFDPRQVFHGLSTLYMYAIGVGVQDATWHSYGANDDAQIRQAALAQATEFFSSLDPDTYPSFQRVTPVLAAHDEDQQFLAGADLLIAGLRAQLTEPARPRAPRPVPSR
jgi:AcrR family transcriptional regulator